MQVYRLRFTSPFHLGRGRQEWTEIDPLPRSDTLTAAIFSLWSHLFPDDAVEDLAQAPPFAFSSALPWVVENGHVNYFLPCPIGLLDGLAQGARERKSLKKVSHLTPELIRLRLRGELLPNTVGQRYGGMDVHLWSHNPGNQGSVVLPFQHRAERLRLTVDRLGGGSVPGLLFDFASVAFAPNCGVAVFAWFVSKEIQRKVEAVLRLLAEEGLGGDRTAGLGEFELIAEEEVLFPDLGSGGRLLMSLYHPTTAEVEAGVLEGARYELVTRRGWVTAPGAMSLGRQAVRMLLEGSVIPDLGKDLYGDAVRVLEPLPELGLHHPIFRGGPALTLPIRLPWEHKDDSTRPTAL
jgi:CRISPR-associated protein Csm4